MIVRIHDYHGNWIFFKQHIKNLKYSFGPAFKISLDENIGMFAVTENNSEHSAIEATELLKILGNSERAFKNLLNYITDGEHQRMGTVNNCNNLSDLIMECVVWDRTEEGEHFWNAVHNELMSRGY